jgi:hypothetical protein
MEPMDLLELDSRGRASLGRFFPQAQRLIASRDEFGRLVLEPAIVVRPLTPRLLANPALAERIEKSFDLSDPSNAFVPYVPKARRGLVESELIDPVARLLATPGSVEAVELTRRFLGFTGLGNVERSKWGATSKDGENLMLMVTTQFVFWCRFVDGVWHSSICLACHNLLATEIDSLQATNSESIKMWTNHRAQQAGIRGLKQRTLTLPLSVMQGVFDNRPEIVGAARLLVESGVRSKLSFPSRWSNPSVEDHLLSPSA